MPASPEGVARLHGWLDRVLAGPGYEVAAAWPVYVAIDEVITNVARHGYGGDRLGEVEAIVTVDPAGISVTLADEAPPFDPRQVPRPGTTGMAGAPRPRAGGHGIALVLALMDHVGYEYREGRNVVTLVASFAPRPRTTP